MKDEGLIKMVLTCERCRAVQEVDQEASILFGLRTRPKSGDYSVVPLELFDRKEYDVVDLKDNDGDNSMFLCWPCEKKYVKLRRRLLEAVDRNLFHFLKTSGDAGARDSSDD